MALQTLSDSRLEEEVWKLYLSWSKRHDLHADLNRVPRRKSWDVDTIIAQNPVPQPVNDKLVAIAKSFLAVEQLIGDYTRQILTLVRNSAGRTFFTAMWAGEEAIHSRALTQWLMAAGVWQISDVLEF